jgi:sirohydrochlorin ferrochelatase
MKRALLLIAHGSRQEEANADLYHVVQAMQARGQYDLVEACFLELTGPTIAEGGAQCVEQGATRVVMLPYFLSPGIHVRRDLTSERDLLSERFPGVAFLLAQPLGRHPLLIDVVVDRAQEAERTSESVSPPVVRQ